MNDYSGLPNNFTKPPEENPPIFNAPKIVLYFIAFLAGIHLIRVYLLSSAQDLMVLTYGAFYPPRYLGALETGVFFDVSTFFTYSFLHGDMFHLMMNCAMLLAFGSVVARRIGATRFVVLWLVSAFASALSFYVLNLTVDAVLIGASGSISALMGAATRFAFPNNGSFVRENVHFLPRVSIIDAFKNRTALFFILIWLGVNIFLINLLGFGEDQSGSAIAWEAHVGGFLFGLLTFRFFDHKNWD